MASHLVNLPCSHQDSRLIGLLVNPLHNQATNQVHSQQVNRAVVQVVSQAVSPAAYLPLSQVAYLVANQALNQAADLLDNLPVSQPPIRLHSPVAGLAPSLLLRLFP